MDEADINLNLGVSSGCEEMEEEQPISGILAEGRNKKERREQQVDLTKEAEERRENEQRLEKRGRQDDEEIIEEDGFVTVGKAADQFIPLIKVCDKPNNEFRPKPYWTPELSHSIAQRRLALKIFRNNPTPDNLTTLERLTAATKTAIQRARSNDWQTYCSSIDEQTSSSDMWKRMGWIKGIHSSRSYISNEQKLELLCTLAPDYTGRQSFHSFKSNNSELDNSFTIQEMTHCFKRKDTAPGND
ncbi:hypothetical protein HF086_002654, partial [Spodoptera exigua]